MNGAVAQALAALGRGAVSFVSNIGRRLRKRPAEERIQEFDKALGWTEKVEPTGIRQEPPKAGT